MLSYQTRNEGLKATTDNWGRLKVLLKCLVSVEEREERFETEDAKCTPRQQSKKEALTVASGEAVHSIPRARGQMWQ